MKKLLFIILAFTSSIYINAEGSANIKKFLKGNLSEKTEAVKRADASEVNYLSTNAISFAIENKELLGEDRDLAALAVSGILALPASYIDSLSEADKNALSYDLQHIYNIFSDQTVKIAVLNKISKLNISTAKFTESLNSYIAQINPETENSAVLSATIQTLGIIGNSETFSILYKSAQNKNWSKYNPEIEESIGFLSSKAEKEVLSLIGTGSVSDCAAIFKYISKNQKNSQNFRAKISENVLARTIYIYENSGTATEELIQLQIAAFEELKNLKQPRASGTAIAYFEAAQKQYSSGVLQETDFSKIIEGLAETSPIDCVSKLSAYLSSLNKEMEADTPSVSEPVVLSVINTLGAVGDKNAFDSLLAVTYYNYSDSVIAAARSALAKLKW